MIKIPDLTVNESEATVHIPIRRIAGDLSLITEIIVMSCDNTAIGKIIYSSMIMLLIQSHNGKAFGC